MGTSNSLLAYEDVRDLLDRAVASARGVSVTVESYGQAIRLRQRIYSFRRIMQRESTKVYRTDDPMYGKTVYDALVVPQFEKIAGETKVELKVVKTQGGNLEVKEL